MSRILKLHVVIDILIADNFCLKDGSVSKVAGYKLGSRGSKLDRDRNAYVLHYF
jgi:hypothetical protein